MDGMHGISWKQETHVNLINSYLLLRWFWMCRYMLVHLDPVLLAVKWPHVCSWLQRPVQERHLLVLYPQRQCLRPGCHHAERLLLCCLSFQICHQAVIFMEKNFSHFLWLARLRILVVAPQIFTALPSVYKLSHLSHLYSADSTQSSPFRQ